MKLRFTVLGVMTVCSALLTAGARWLAVASSDSSGQRDMATPVSASAGRRIHALGYVEPVSQVRRLAFKYEGEIGCCYVSVGSRVKAGEVLMALNDRDERAAVALAEKSLALAIAEREQLLAGIDRYQIIAAQRKVDSRRVQAKFAAEDLERATATFRAHALSAAEFDRIRSTKEQAEADLHEAEAELSHLVNFVRPDDRSVAEAKVSCAQAGLDVANARLQNTRLLAPSDGTVLEILKREGEGIRGIDPEPAVIFADGARLQVRAEIDERYVSQVHAGQKAVISGRGLGARRVEGKVAIVKQLMGAKKVFARTSEERKDLEALEVFIDAPELTAPLGLQVDIEIAAEETSTVEKERT